MNGELSIGYKVKTLYNATVTVKKLLGEGGQGYVYLVDYDGQEKALKWYKKGYMNQVGIPFYEHIKHNVIKKSPGAEFLWPQDITNWDDGTFGYIMDVRPQGYYDVTDIMLCKVRFKSYKTVIDAALHIISAFRALHNAGYAYQDMNDGNFFINPQTGKVLICDNDNVAAEGETTGIQGKPRYMAPEVVTKKNAPNSASDLFSMSVILYILFCLNHPLEGKRYLEPGLPPELQEKLYGTEPLFIMDKNDQRNGPHPVAHKNTLTVWPCLPSYMQDFFQEVFSQKSLLHPSCRPAEIEWLKVLTRFRSDIVECSCGNEIFTKNGRPCKCDACGRAARIPFRLDFSNYSIPAIPGSRIYRIQLGVCNQDAALTPVASVVSKPTGELGIRNVYSRHWDAVNTKGAAKKVAPKDVIPLKHGIRFTVESETISISQNK